jgi:hypothetical protein
MKNGEKNSILPFKISASKRTPTHLRARFDRNSGPAAEAEQRRRPRRIEQMNDHAFVVGAEGEREDALVENERFVAFLESPCQGHNTSQIAGATFVQPDCCCSC